MEKMIDELGFAYYELPPQGFLLVTSPSEFFTLKQGKRKWIKDNIEVVVGSEMLVYSEHMGRYYIREVKDYHNPYEFENLMKMIRKGRVHIKYSQECANKIKAQFMSTDLTYNSMVMVNEFNYDLEQIGTRNMDDGIKSRRRAVEQMLIQFSNNKRK